MKKFNDPVEKTVEWLGGSDEGDKIPAKYEPGEFVVSNDMIDDNPGLREQLSELRTEILAARGKTVDEADQRDPPQSGLPPQDRPGRIA